MKVVTKHIFILVLCIFGSRLIAQHQNVWSNYQLNASSINPAAIGKDEALDVNIYSRKQWAGFSGSPLTNALAINSMIKRPSVNIGLFISDDRIGSTVNQNFLLNYTYRIKFKKFRLGFGLQGGVQVMNTNLNGLNRVNEIDQVVEQNQNKKTGLTAGAGIYLHNDKLYGGVSIPNLYNVNSFNINTVPIYLNGGYMFKVRNGQDVLKPSFLVRRIESTRITYDINLMYYINSKFGIGGSYRTKSAIVGMLELLLTDQFKIAYCYDYSTTSISRYQNGSHELSLRYLFGKKLKMNNPRALYF